LENGVEAPYFHVDTSVMFQRQTFLCNKGDGLLRPIFIYLFILLITIWKHYFDAVYASKIDGVLSALPKTKHPMISPIVFLPRVNA
jgi:hypothetical protein